MLPSSNVTNEPTIHRNPPIGPPPPLPSIVIDNVEGNDDDPPPYSMIAPPDHVGWPFGFSRIRPEGTDQHASTSMPLMPYRVFKCGSRRSLFGHGTLPLTDDTSVSKDDRGRTRKYGATLIGGAMITFLMVLSLVVRVVMSINTWRDYF